MNIKNFVTCDLFLFDIKALVEICNSENEYSKPKKK